MMKSKRQREAEKEAGVNSDKTQSQIDKARQAEEERIRRGLERQAEIEQSSSYMITKKIKKVMDDWYLDGILGIFGVGDWLVLGLGLPTLYITIFKLHSFKLTVICLFYLFLDFLVGLVPVLGDFLDFFFKGYKYSFDLIEGYVANDPETIRSINKRFLVVLVCLIGLMFLLYFVFSLILKCLDATFNFIFG